MIDISSILRTLNRFRIPLVDTKMHDTARPIFYHSYNSLSLKAGLLGQVCKNSMMSL